MAENKLSRAAGLDANSECISASLDLFSAPLKDVSLERCYYQELWPTPPLSDGANMISFHIPVSEDYTDASESLVQLAVKIQKADGSDGAAQTTADSYGLINLPVSSLFQSVNIRLNDTLVTDSFGTYPFTSFLQVLLNYGHESRKTRLRLCGWVDDTDPTAKDAETATDTGFKTRADWTTGAKVLHLLGPVFSGIFNQQRLLPPLLPIYIDFIKSTNEFAIIRSKAGANYQYKIISMKMLIRRVRPTASTKLTIEKQLQSRPARYPITHSYCKPMFIPEKTVNISFSDIWTGSNVPKFCLLALMRQSDFNGNYETSPFYFSPNKMKSMSISFGGFTYPSLEFKPDFKANGQWLRSYYSLMLNSFKLDSANMVTYDLFATYFTLWIIDLGQFSLAATDHVTAKNELSARLDINFEDSASTTAPALVCLMYAENDQEIQIDKNRVITKDFVC